MIHLPAEVPTAKQNNHCFLVEVGVGQTVCEPVLWCRWHHRGQMIATRSGSALDLVVDDVIELLERYPVLRDWGAPHAERFVHSLNFLSSLDLFDTKDCINFMNPRVKKESFRQSWRGSRLFDD